MKLQAAGRTFLVSSEGTNTFTAHRPVIPRNGEEGRRLDQTFV